MPGIRRSKSTPGLSAIAWLAGLLLMGSGAAMLRGQSTPAQVPFTQAQAADGARVYSQRCAGCHGPRLDDGEAPPLIGSKFIETWSAPARALDDLLFIIRTTMPKGQAGTLPASDYVAVLAHILDRNG